MTSDAGEEKKFLEAIPYYPDSVSVAELSRIMHCAYSHAETLVNTLSRTEALCEDDSGRISRLRMKD